MIDQELLFFQYKSVTYRKVESVAMPFSALISSAPFPPLFVSSRGAMTAAEVRWQVRFYSMILMLTLMILTFFRV